MPRPLHDVPDWAGCWRPAALIILHAQIIVTGELLVYRGREVKAAAARHSMQQHVILVGCLPKAMTPDESAEINVEPARGLMLMHGVGSTQGCACMGALHAHNSWFLNVIMNDNSGEMQKAEHTHHMS
jgi:hypothetical protein